jgi:uncharacterized protein
VAKRQGSEVGAVTPEPPAHQRRPRRVPQRTCVACRRVEGKRQLIRIVRTPAGTVEVDPTGRKNGRGAYLHADPACWETAFRRKALQHALKTELGDADRVALEVYGASLEPVPEAGPGAAKEEGDEQR